LYQVVYEGRCVWGIKLRYPEIRSRLLYPNPLVVPIPQVFLQPPPMHINFGPFGDPSTSLLKDDWSPSKTIDTIVREVLALLASPREFSWQREEWGEGFRARRGDFDREAREHTAKTARLLECWDEPWLQPVLLRSALKTGGGGETATGVGGWGFSCLYQRCGVCMGRWGLG
jgi:ubiquitin-protein ligase